MKIRDFQKDDYVEFIDMCRDFYSGDAVDHEVDSANFMRTFNELMNNNPFLRALMLEHNGKRAGYAQLSFTWSNEAGGMVVWIEELYIKPEFRGTGFGSQLIDFVRREYKDKAARFRLEVSAANAAAARLYSRLGFKPLDYRQMIIDEPLSK